MCINNNNNDVFNDVMMNNNNDVISIIISQDVHMSSFLSRDMKNHVIMMSSIFRCIMMIYSPCDVVMIRA